MHLTPSDRVARLPQGPWVRNASAVHVALDVYHDTDDHLLGLVLSYHLMTRSKASVSPSVPGAVLCTQ